MESHFEWPCAVDLRCAPLGPCLETHFERKLSLGHCFVLYFRATLRASLLPFSEIHSEWNIISNGKLDFWATLTRRLEAQGAQTVGKGWKGLETVRRGWEGLERVGKGLKRFERIGKGWKG